MVAALRFPFGSLGSVLPSAVTGGSAHEAGRAAGGGRRGTGPRPGEDARAAFRVLPRLDTGRGHGGHHPQAVGGRGRELRPGRRRDRPRGAATRAHEPAARVPPPALHDPLRGLRGGRAAAGLPPLRRRRVVVGAGRRPRKRAGGTARAALAGPPGRPAAHPRRRDPDPLPGGARVPARPARGGRVARAGLPPRRADHGRDARGRHAAAVAPRVEEAGRGGGRAARRAGGRPAHAVAARAAAGPAAAGGAMPARARPADRRAAATALAGGRGRAAAPGLARERRRAGQRAQPGRAARRPAGGDRAGGPAAGRAAVLEGCSRANYIRLMRRLGIVRADVATDVPPQPWAKIVGVV